MECKYHPQQQASWYCGRCDIGICMDCVPNNKNNMEPKCTLCRGYLQPVGISDSITPFWLKIGHFFAYPFALPLFIIAVLSSVVAMIMPPAVDFRFYQIPLAIGWAAFLMKVLFSVMEYSAYGNLDKVDWNKMMATKNGWMFVKMLLLFAIAFFAIYKAAEFSSILGIALFVFLLVSFPAINIILCMDKSIIAALNPARILYVMSAIGGAYWILLVLIAMFYLTIGFGEDFLARYITPEISIPLADFFYAFVSIAMYHMYGYVIYQYHFELDWSVDRYSLHDNYKSHGKNTSLSSGSSNDKTQSSSGGLIEAQILVQEGRYESAEAALVELLKHEEYDPEVYEMLMRLFELQGKPDKSTKVAIKELPILLERKEFSKYRLRFSQIIEKQPEYRPETPEETFTLLKLFNRKQDAQTALLLLNHLKNNFIDFPNLAEACFIFGKYLLEKHNNKAKATQIITWGLNLASNDLKDEMNQYLKLI